MRGGFLRTARYHEACAAEKDGNDGSGGGGEHREQSWVPPESVYWTPDRSIDRRVRFYLEY